MRNAHGSPANIVAGRIALGDVSSGRVRLVSVQPAKGAMHVRLTVHLFALVPGRPRRTAARWRRRRERRIPCSPSSSPASRQGSRSTPARRASRVGPDGNVWMTQRLGAGRIAKVTPAGVGDRVHRRSHAGLLGRRLSDGNHDGAGRQRVVHGVLGGWADRADHAGGSGDRVPARRRTPARRRSRPDPTAICGSRRAPTRGGSRRSPPPARSAPSPRAARTSAPTATRARSRSGRTATSGSPSSTARDGSGGSRRRAS